MIEEIDLETYLYISNDRLIISLFNKKDFKNLYKSEFLFKNPFYDINLEPLSEFLNKNIFKIEKLIGKFIKNISVVIEDKNNLNVELCIKKKNYGNLINQKSLEHPLKEAKDQFKKNYPNNILMHMLIADYLIDNKSYSSLVKNLKCDNFCLEINFISISNKFIYKLEGILKKYQIKIDKTICGHYVKSFCISNNIGLCEMTQKLVHGYNENEVMLVPKNIDNKGFFERFFQLFS